MMNITKHMIRSVIKFVVVTLSSPTMFLYKKPGEYEFTFKKNIETATKTMNKEDAEYLIKQYHHYTGDTQFDLVVLPLNIEYSLIEE